MEMLENFVCSWAGVLFFLSLEVFFAYHAWRWNQANEERKHLGISWKEVWLDMFSPSNKK